MVDIFAKEGISKPRDIFSDMGIAPSLSERNQNALSPEPLERAPETVRMEVESHQNQYEQLAKARFSQEQIDQMKAKGPIGFWEAKNFLDYQDILPGGGVYEAFDTAVVYKAAKKMEAGEELSVNEQATLDKFIDQNIETNLRGFKVGGGIMYYGARMPAFMTEFAATGGVGKLAQKGTEALVEKGVQKVVLSKAAGLTANVLARTAAMPTMYLPKYAEQRLNDFMAVTDKGSVVFKQSEESPAMSALKAFGHTSAEVASELFGAAIGKYLIKPVAGVAGRYLKTPLTQAASKLPTALRQNLYEAYKAINPNARVSKVFSAAGWNGMLEELGEERIADVLHASLNMATDKDYTFDDYLNAITPSKDQLLIESGIIAIAGGTKTAADIGFNLLLEKTGDVRQAREIIDNMSASEQESFVQQNLNLAPSTPVPLADGVIGSQVKAAQEAEPSLINDEESSFGQFYREFVNGLQPIEKVTKEAQARGAEILPGENPFVLSRTYAGVIGNIQQNLQVGTTRLNKETGVMEVNGKALGSIMDDFDNSVSHLEPLRENREQDFNDYLVARRTLEDLKDREDVEVSEADIVKSGETMRNLAAKYGDDFNWFDTFAKEMYEYQQRVLQNLVDADVMSKEQFDEILKKNPNYIPFQRVIEEDERFKDFVTSKGIFTNADSRKVIKRIQGSDKEVKNVMQSVIANTAKILDIAHRNRVAKGLYDLSGVLPDYVEKMPPIMIKRGTAQVKVTYDAGLRRKLEAAIKAFGNTIERKKSLKMRGMGFVRGSYSPMEKMVRMRLGSNEGTLAHEVGHMLDHSLDLKKKILSNEKAYKELVKLAEERLGGREILTQQGNRIIFEDRVLDVASEKYMDYIRNDDEILANMFDAYVNSPDLLQKKSPTARRLFDDIIRHDPQLNFISQIKPSLERAEETIEQDVWGPADFAPSGTVTVFVNGEKKYLRVAKPLLEAVNNLSPIQFNATMSMLLSPFRTSAKLLRAGATLIPEFWIRNVLRDQGTAFLQSPVRPTPIDTIQGLAAVIGKTELYNDWMRNGGSFNSYMDLDDKGLEKAYKELFRPQGKFSRYTKNPLMILNDISMALEQATRIGAFKKARENGIVGLEAALLAREATLDFARGGTVAKNINQYVPFFNAGVQSVDKLIRTFKENPAGTMFWGIATITVPSVLLTGYYLYGAPDDERKEYLEIPQWQRDLFWVFKAGGQWLRIPKPFSFGYIFGSVPERFMTWGFQGEKPEIKGFWEQLVRGVVGTLSPVYDPSAVLPPLVKVTIEDLTNYNFFTGRDIYPEWMDRYEPEQRKTKFTSETATLIGERLGVSPALVDNTLRGALAGSADYITDAGDQILKQVKKWNGEEIPAKPITPADIPVIKAFSVREPTGYGTESVSNFFDAWKKVNEVHATLGRFDSDEKADYAEKNAKLLHAYEPMKGYYDRIRKLGKLSDQVYEDTGMTSKEKVQALSDYGDQMLDAAREANEWYVNNIQK